MQFLFAAMGMIGLFMFIVGGRWVLASIRFKTIATFYLDGNQKEVLFDQQGLYSVSTAVRNLREEVNLNVVITHNGRAIQVDYPFIKYRFKQKGSLAKEVCQFEIEQKGKYLFSFKNDNLSNATIYIKEAMKNPKRVLGIVLLVLGFNIASWGIILLCNPDIANKIGQSF